MTNFQVRQLLRDPHFREIELQQIPRDINHIRPLFTPKQHGRIPRQPIPPQPQTNNVQLPEPRRDPPGELVPRHVDVQVT
ncbi:hypothetical protein Syun_016751 [Stephania yunnanensis]|uniref:Uncharacterized protein n=1 Tax=Stephania yunnanensis TaxID=152371 RepID=A0AAP0J5T6_9MAGN